MDKALADKIVTMYRDEGESSRRIVRILRACGVHVNENIVHGVLREAGLSNAKNMGKKKIEIPNLDELAARWAGGAGETLAVLAKEAGVSGETLARRLQEAGYARRVTPRFRVGCGPIERLEYAAMLYQNGRTLRQIATELKVDQTRLANQLKDCGLIPDMDLRLLRGKNHPSARRGQSR